MNEKRSRPLRVAICFSHEEYAQYQKQLEASGLTKQTHGLKALLEREIRPRPCDHHPALLKVLSDVSNDTSQILRALHSNGQLTAAECTLLKEQLNRCWQEIRDKY